VDELNPRERSSAAERITLGLVPKASGRDLAFLERSLVLGVCVDVDTVHVLTVNETSTRFNVEA
jgi:hypothetical protein